MLLIERRLRVAVIVGGALALMIGVAVAAPWFIAMEHAHPGYLDYYLLQRHVLGFTTATQRHGKSAWHYYLPVVLGGGLPWILLRAVHDAPWRRPRASDPITESRFTDATRLGWSLLLTGTLFLSLSKSKLLTYALPVFPAIALLAAVAWLAWQQRPGDHPSRWFGADAGGAGSASAPSSCPRRSSSRPRSSRCRTSGGCGWLPPRLPQDGGWPHASCGGTPKRRRRWAPRMTAATLIVALAVLVPPVANVTTAKDLAETINRSGRFPPELWMVEQRSGSLVFYLDPALRRDLTRQRVLQLSSPQVPEHEPVPGTRVAVTVGDSPRLDAIRAARGPAVRAGRALPHVRWGAAAAQRRAAEPTACSRARPASPAAARPAVRLVRRAR